MQPSLLILDEPTAQLDPVAARQFLQAVQRVHEELGVTVLLCEHALEEVLPLASQVLFCKTAPWLLMARPRLFCRGWRRHLRRIFDPHCPLPAAWRFPLAR